MRATTLVVGFSVSAASFCASTFSAMPCGLTTETDTQCTPLSALLASNSRSTHTASPRSSTPSSNQSQSTARSKPRRNTKPRGASGRGSFLRTVLAPLRPPALRLLVTLWASLLDGRSRWRSLGATMTSASGEIFTNGELAGGGGATLDTMTLAALVGER